MQRFSHLKSAFRNPRASATIRRARATCAPSRSLFSSPSPLVQQTQTPPRRRTTHARYFVAALGALGASLALYSLDEKRRNQVAEACGIIAYIGPDQASTYLMEGLTILQNRGYDSCGISTLNDGRITTTKYASRGSTSDSIDLLAEHAPLNHAGDTVGIAHTRWATHGGKTDENAHPHMDEDKQIALVHNGTIENCDELREELEGKGKKFLSQTDTEVIAQLIGLYLNEGLPLLDAVRKTLSRLEGAWGIAVIHKDSPNQIIAARNGSPLVVGIGKDRMFVASETSAFSRHTTQYIALDDGEVAVINQTDLSLNRSRITEAVKEDIELSPAPYEHWTIKEIMEQPEAISRTLSYGGRFLKPDEVKLGGLDENKESLLQIKHLMLGGCGTSYFAAMFGASLMRTLGSFDSVQTMDSAEMTDEAFSKHGAGLCVISQSGETKDTHRTLKVAKHLSIPTFSVVNQVGSLIARTTNCGVYLHAGREHAVASTKAFTTQATALALVATWFAQGRAHAVDDLTNTKKRRELIEAIHRLPVYMGMTLKCRDQIKDIAAKLDKKEHIFVLGKGLGQAIAMEGALKIKEITYVHAEGYSGGALKHGPFALLEEGTPVIMLVLDDDHTELMRIAAQEVKARGAYTIVITDKPGCVGSQIDEIIPIPHNGPLSALLAVVPLQLLAYEMSVRRGINPDKPRNLAKAVTTD